MQHLIRYNFLISFKTWVLKLIHNKLFTKEHAYFLRDWINFVTDKLQKKIF